MSRRRRSAAVATLLVALGAFASTSAAQSDPEPAPTAVPVVVIDGRGHGHGVGLSQWGAHTMAERGSSAAEIISTFYPGTHLGSGGGEIAVRVDDRSRVQVSFPDGGELRAGRDGSDGVDGFPVAVPPGAIVTVTHGPDGYRVTGDVVGASAAPAVRHPVSGTSWNTSPSRPASVAQDGCLIPGLCPTTTTTTTTSTTTTVPVSVDDTDAPPSDGGPSDTPPTSPVPVWAVPTAGGTVTAVDRGRNYRGVLEISGTTVTNHVDVEQYLRGMIEVPGHWPPAAVQAQTIAARTFALRAMATGGSICDTDACQVYLGTARESAGLDAAVAATAGTVVLYGDGYAATFFSASSGGISATPEEGFGNDTQVPYLQAVEHPDADPQPWRAEFALDEIGRRFGYPGTPTEVRVDEVGPSGRAVAMSIDGDAGAVDVDPQDFRSQLDLRSTLYTVDMAMSDGSPMTPDTTTTSRPRPSTAGVQTPTAGEPILLAVAPGGDEPIPWPVATVAAACIVGVTTAGIVGFGRRRRPVRVGPWRRSRS